MRTTIYQGAIMESIEELATPSIETTDKYDVYAETAAKAAIGAIVAFGVTMALKTVQKRIEKRLSERAANKINPEPTTED